MKKKNQREEIVAIVKTAFVLIRRTVVSVVDEEWAQTIGNRVALPGGTELICDGDGFAEARQKYMENGAADTAWVSLVVNDPFYPAMTVALTVDVLYHGSVIGEPGGGPRVDRPIVECLHRRPHPGCDYCFYKMWRSL